MEESLKKSFRIKCKALQRTFKQYQVYKNEFDAYDINLISQDKKQTQFYEQSKGALEHVQKNLIEFYQQLNSFIDENQNQINQDDTVKQDYQKAKQNIKTIKGLFPASL